MRTHVQRCVAGCFAILRQLRFVPAAVYQTRVVALVLSLLDYGKATLAGLPACLVNRLQSLLNAAARSIADLRRSDHITDILASFHWLRIIERIKFKLVVILYRCPHRTAPQYVSDTLQYIADMPARGRLRSSTSGHLDVRQSRLVTVGDRSFVTGAPRFQNSLSSDVQSASPLKTFRRGLKAHLFQQSYPDIILQ